MKKEYGYFIFAFLLFVIMIVCFPYITLKNQIIFTLITLSLCFCSYWLYIFLTLKINNIAKQIPETEEEYKKCKVESNLFSKINALIVRETLFDVFFDKKLKYKIKLNDKQLDFLVRKTEEETGFVFDTVTFFDSFDNNGLTIIKEDEKYYLNICNKYIKANKSFVINR